MLKRYSVLAAACLLACVAPAGAADVAYVTAPIPSAVQKVSTASTPREYRMDVARHIYASYPQRIYKGRLPPLIHAVVVVENVIDERGQTRDVKVVRGPSHAPDVTAAVREMTFRASPMPMPSRLGTQVRYTEIWLVHKDGRFQLDALTEGQD